MASRSGIGDRGSGPRGDADRSEIREVVGVTLVYAALTFVMALPFSASPGTQVLGDVPDTHLFLWTLAWDTWAFLHQPLTIFDANIYHPYANTLAYSENLIGSAFFAAPIIWLTGDVVLAMNLVTLMTTVLCGAGAYFLARRLGIGPGGAFICGVIFAFAPPRFFRMGQLHLTAVQWMPFSLAFLHSYLDRQTRRDLLLAIACFSLQALSSGHGAAYLAVTIVALLAWRVACGEPPAILQRLRDVGVAGAYLIAPAIWVILPYRMAQAEAGLKRDYLSGAQPGIESWLASPARFHQFLKASFLEPFPKEADAFLFPGILVLMLAVVAVARRLQPPLRDNWTVFYLLLAVLSTLMLVEWPFELWRYVYWLPGFNFIRVPSRFMILSMLALAVLAGVGVERLVSRASLTGRAVVTIAVAALLLGEYSTYPFSGVPYRLDIPAVDRWLDTRPKPFIVAEVPVPSPGDLGGLERQQTRSMLHSTAHFQKTIHGYSGIRRPFHHQLYIDLTEFPLGVSIARLREVGVNYVVVHTEAYENRWGMIEEQIARTPALRLEHADGAGRVYSILPP